MRLNLSEFLKDRDRVILPLSLFVLTVITRIPFTSELLYHMDSVQFALALKNYNVTVHQPHPPGYFLYVMLGRLFNYFINDANAAFVSISIIFSGLTVIAVYYLGKIIFDHKTGLLAAILALTSPNLWFHGEVALSYIVEAFFSTAVALLCWRLHKQEHKYIWLSVIALAVAGGIRQNTVIFLFPLWLFSVKEAPIRKVMASLGLLGFFCLLWLVPMILMTGGLEVYREAFRELWMFNSGNVSVFARGWSSFRTFSSALLVFIIYGMGAGVFVTSLAAYSLIHNGRLNSLDMGRVIFFSLWVLPSIFFYLLIFIHPANPGYSLVFLPALLVLTAASVRYVRDELKQLIKKDLYTLIVSGLITVNLVFFFFSKLPVSYREIRDHDRDLAILLDGIKGFDPSKTAIFVEPYIFFGYRQIMYYLPEYRVYDVDLRIAPTGERRKIFWGLNMETHLTDKIELPGAFDSFIALVHESEKDKLLKIDEVSIKSLPPYFNLVSGPISFIHDIYPKLRGVIEQ